ncbi:MAG: hypothetical protein BWY76_02489 [bacterium ADurb.Bin429]|nr:MAG: hypothetical protein BWY76_02489 [bacterium ADurb.Bin429]
MDTRAGLVRGLLATGGSRQALEAYRNELQERMTAHGAHIRARESVSAALAEARAQLVRWDACGVSDPADLPYALKNRDAVITQITYLAAMEEALARGGISRGSYMVMRPDGQPPCEGLDGDFRFVLGDDPLKEEICEVSFQSADAAVACAWVPRRPIPADDGWYENIWADYREDKIIRDPDEGVTA